MEPIERDHSTLHIKDRVHLNSLSNLYVTDKAVTYVVQKHITDEPETLCSHQDPLVV